MPLTSINYLKLVIYKIVCNNLEITDSYVGSTTQFTKRKTLHKSNCNNEKSREYHFKLYQTIRDNGGWENWKMLEIEKFPCKDGNEARKQERYHYEILHSNLNMQYPERSNKEYYIEYNIRNRDELKVKRKIYRELNEEKIKEYREINREKAREKAREKITCICSRITTKDNLTSHKKTKIHLDFVNK
jgi:hypothetical protein